MVSDVDSQLKTGWLVEKKKKGKSKSKSKSGSLEARSYFWKLEVEARIGIV